MSSRYGHLSKAGERVLRSLNNTHKNLAARQEKYAKISVPDFIKPALPEVKDHERFKTCREWMFVPGDRVVIMKGKYKGNICVVKQQDVATNGFILDDNGPMKNTPVPKQFWLEGQKSHMISVPQAVSQKDLRLVADIDDPLNAGQTRTVAVKNIEFKGTYYDENYKKMMPYRTVIGQSDLVIPWPKPAPQEDGELATEPSIAREQTFWVDSIVKNPIPKDAFMTIRNPHSKFRRGKLTARDISKLVAPKMPMTDVKKAYIKEKQQLASRPKAKLTDDEKELIGEKIYQHLKEQGL